MGREGSSEVLDPAMQAEQRWGVDLSNDHEVMAKIVELGGQMPDVADLGNLWQELQEQKKAA